MRFATLALSMVWALSAQTPFRAKPEGSIGGIVRDAATGTPLVDAAVRVWRVVAIEGGTIPQISDREWTSTEGGGRYRIPKAGIGDIEVTAKAEGHATVSRKAHLDADADLTLDFDLPPNPTISGHVLDENKKPTSALVWLIASEYRSGLLLRRRIGPGMADETGHFAFDSELEAGRSYDLLAERPVTRDRAIAPKPLEEREEVDESTYYGDVHSLRDATPITLRPGQHYDVADIKIHKAKPYCVDGRTKLAGEPASVSIGIREAAMAEISLTPLEFESADDGSFHVCGLTPGEYALVPVKSQRSGLTAFTISNADLENIQLNLDTANLFLDLSWDGDPPSEPHPPLLSSLAVGFRTRLSADGTPQLERIGNRTGSKMGAGAEIAILLSGVDVPQVNKSEKAPYRGPFGSNPDPGDYAIEVRAAESCYVKELTYGGVPVTDGVLHLAGGVSGTLRVVTSQGAAAVTAKVTDADGKPLPDTNMVLIPDRVASAGQFSALARQGLSDAAGTITWGNLAPGKYRVLALTRLYQATPEDIDKVLAVLPKAPIVELDPKSKAQVTVQPASID